MVRRVVERRKDTRNGIRIGASPDAIRGHGSCTCLLLTFRQKLDTRHVCGIKTVPLATGLTTERRAHNKEGSIDVYRLFRQRALHWQLLLVSVEFGMLTSGVYAAVMLRYWGDADTQLAISQMLRWRAPLVAGVLIAAMAALGLYQIHLRAGWLGRLSRQGVAFLLGAVILTVVYYAYPDAYVGRGVLALALAFGYLVVALWRMLFLAFVDADLFKRRVIMLGAGERV